MEQMKSLLETIEKLPSEVNVEAAFGAPQEHDNYVVIPVAEITYGYGVGFCTSDGCCTETAGKCCNDTEDEKVSDNGETGGLEEQGEHGMGSGGGIGAKARPLAYIEVSPDGTKIKPIVDEQKIAFMGILLVAWVVGWIGLVLKAIISPRK